MLIMYQSLVAPQSKAVQVEIRPMTAMNTSTLVGTVILLLPSSAGLGCKLLFKFLNLLLQGLDLVFQVSDQFSEIHVELSV